MTGLVVLLAGVFGAFVGTRLGREERAELDAEVCELREVNARLALSEAAATYQLQEARWEAYMTGWLEGVAAEKERHQ